MLPQMEVGITPYPLSQENGPNHHDLKQSGLHSGTFFPEPVPDLPPFACLGWMWSGNGLSQRAREHAHRQAQM